MSWNCAHESDQTNPFMTKTTIVKVKFKCGCETLQHESGFNEQTAYCSVHLAGIKERITTEKFHG